MITSALAGTILFVGQNYRIDEPAMHEERLAPQALMHWQTEYDVEIYTSQDAEGSDHSGTLLRQARYSWRQDGCRFAFDRTIKGGEAYARHTDFAVSSIWDGHTWQIWNGMERTFTLAQQPSLHVELDCAWLFNLMEGPFFAIRSPLSEFLRRPPNEFESSDRWRRYKYLLPNGQSFVEVEIDDQTDRVDMIAIDGRDEHTGKQRYRNEFRILEWDNFAGMTMPSLAERRSWIFTSSSTQSVNKTTFQRLVFRRISAAPYESEVTAPDLHGEYTVIDKRLDCIYAVGGTEIKIGGHLAMTSPIPSTLDGRTLLELPLHFIPRNLTEGLTGSQSQNATMNSRSWSYVPGLFILGGCVLVIIASRMRQNAKPFLTGVAIIAIGAGWGVSRCTKSRVANLGNQTNGHAFDFGDIEFVGETIVKEHVFVLTNYTDHERKIQSVKSTCGCTSATASVDRVDSGKKFSVKGTLKLFEPGRRNERIWIVYDDGGIDELMLSGNAKSQVSTTVVYKSVQLEPAKAQTISIYAAVPASSATPPEPDLHVPLGVHSEASGWKILDEGDAASGRPKRLMFDWLLRTDRALPSRSFAEVESGLQRYEKVDLTGWAWQR